MFETIIQGQASERAGRKRTVLVSFVIHVLVLGILIVIPLIYYQTIPGGFRFITEAFGGELPTPVPPAPPQPQAVSEARPRVTIPTDRPLVFLSPELIEPGNVPAPPDALEIPMPSDPIRFGPPGPSTGLIPEGVLRNSLGAFPEAMIKTPPPPPPKPPKQPMLISTLDPSRLIYRVEPVYPPLAIKARVQGAVLLQVTVNEMGIVESVEVMSGHALLVNAAREAVKQWRYKPTILNGEPVPVKATVTVNFNLNR